VADRNHAAAADVLQDTYVRGLLLLPSVRAEDACARWRCCLSGSFTKAGAGRVTGAIRSVTEQATP
jgi:hypothetical protein